MASVAKISLPSNKSRPISIPRTFLTHEQLSELYERLGRDADSERELHEYYRLFAPINPEHRDRHSL